MKDDKLWKAFSEFVRLRDADANGYITCITSGRRVHWKDADAGHFISRRYMATKYNEKNVNAQSRHDNRFASGKQYEYGLAIDRKYGKGTAERLYILSKQTSKIGKFEIDELTKYYKQKVKELKAKKVAF